MPSIWLPVKLEQVSLIQPIAHLQQGKIQNIVIQSDHQKYAANCAFQTQHLVQYCSQNIAHKQKITVQSIKLVYLTTPLWHYKNSKKEVFIQNMYLLQHSKDAPLNIHAEISKQKNWLQHQQRFPQLLRWLLSLNILHLIFLVVTKLFFTFKKA